MSIAALLGGYFWHVGHGNKLSECITIASLGNAKYIRNP